MWKLSEINPRYTNSLKEPQTLRVNFEFFALLQALDLAGTLAMVAKYGIGSEANELAKVFLMHNQEALALIKLMAIPVIVTLSIGVVYIDFRKRQHTHNDSEKWSERVVILMQAINTYYLFTFILISTANIGKF